MRAHYAPGMDYGSEQGRQSPRPVNKQVRKHMNVPDIAKVRELPSAL